MSAPRLLIAGVGNVFLGDDGFGVEVVRQLAGRPWPSGVSVRDFGVRGLDLAYALLDGYDAAILVDATQRGRPPGTLYVLEPDAEPADAGQLRLETHGMDPARVLGFVRAMGEGPLHIRVVGCEPTTFGDEDEPLMGLSEEVRAAIAPAVTIIGDLVRELTSHGGRRAHA
ncbi:MAG TPA: hydrogenase maturation protease [Polyangiaceae bacterium]|jgi:hydrogenase maturation protease|nr:hydrogenase maturation protease [Polyangiaceae bacterium]